MDWFDPMRDFFEHTRRKSSKTTKLEQPVQLVTERESSHPLQFGYPSPTIYAGIYAGATRVGSCNDLQTKTFRPAISAVFDQD